MIKNFIIICLISLLTACVSTYPQPEFTPYHLTPDAEESNTLFIEGKGFETRQIDGMLLGASAYHGDYFEIYVILVNDKDSGRLNLDPKKIKMKILSERGYFEPRYISIEEQIAKNKEIYSNGASAALRLGMNNSYVTNDGNIYQDKFAGLPLVEMAVKNAQQSTELIKKTTLQATTLFPKESVEGKVCFDSGKDWIFDRVEVTIYVNNQPYDFNFKKY